MLNQKNRKKQGDVGVAAALAHFVALGCVVSVPFSESSDYDLIVQIGDELKRVQVKTTRCRQHGKYVVCLETRGGNRSWSGIVKKLDLALIDILFVVTADGARYCIDVDGIGGRSGIVLGEKYERYRV